jgi:hypothetical protein
VNRIPLSGDVIERAIPYAGPDRVAAAIARDPALRSLPSDELARRLGTSRALVENAIHGLVVQHTGHRLQVSGRSFDEAISDAGMARRAALSPEPLNEAAGFGAPVRRGAGQSIAEHHYAAMRAPRYATTRTGRRIMSFDARGYQTPPIPDLSMLLLSDAFPVTRRKWSRGNVPTADEVAILNWQHPLVKNATSTQSISTLKAISAGCYSWDTPATVGGNQLAARTPEQRATFWLEMQQIMNDLARDQILYAPNPSVHISSRELGFQIGVWGLLPPKITADETDIWYWYHADASHPYMKYVPWMTQALLKLGAGESVLDATWAKAGATTTIYVSGGKTYMTPHEGADLEKDFMKLFSGMAGIIGALTTAISTALAVYCPACAVAVKIAGNMAQGAAKGAVNVKALASYGDQLLTDAAIKARNGDSAALEGMRAFAAALIGLPASAVQGAQPNGGLVYDYLNMLGTAPKNVAWALQVYALDHSNTIQNAAQLATKAGVPLLDAQYAVAAMTDTLARFASNVTTTYMDPNETGLQKAQGQYIASRSVRFGKNLIPTSLSDLPLLPGRQSQMTGTETAVVAGAAVGIAWYMGLLKGLI